MKFRRKSTEADATEELDDVEAAESEPTTTAGPYDVDEMPDDGRERIDLGSLLVLPEDGRELRIQVDESTGAVDSVLVAGTDGALDVRAFAAPRNGDLWSDVRPQIAAEMAQRGGTASEREGRWGTELLCQLPATRPDGSAGMQPSRVIGINGPRWMLRATLLGRPALEPEGAAAWEDTISMVAVRRGGEAMPVGDVLPITLPESARKVEDDQDQGV